MSKAPFSPTRHRGPAGIRHTAAVVISIGQRGRKKRDRTGDELGYILFA